MYNDVLGNTIAFNGASGVAVLDGGDTVRIGQNSIYANGPGLSRCGLEIDLGGDGPTPTTPGTRTQARTGGKKFPVLTSARTSGNITVVRGTLSSTPDTSFRIELSSTPNADPSGYGEGRFYLPPSTEVVTDGSGIAAFTFRTEEAIPVGHVVAAEALAKDKVWSFTVGG